jgi:hypothetical protein
MLAFLVPIKSPQAASSWSDVCRLFERTLRSVCRQTSPDFRVLVVCNEVPTIDYSHPNVEFLTVDFPPPNSDYDSKAADKDKKLLTGLVGLRKWQPSHVMMVDADDCISRRLAEHVGRNPDKNGWYCETGYEYEDGGDTIVYRKERFYCVCGTSNVIAYKLFTLPETLPPFEEMVEYDRFMGGHACAKPDLAERGTPLEALPFPGAVYMRDSYGESLSLQEEFGAKLFRNPREAFRRLKKRLMAPLAQRPLTQELRDEFGIYAID